MKKILLLVFILSYTYNLNAQCDSTLPITEDFSDTTAVNFCWDFIDSDGDGFGWFLYDLGGGNQGLKSHSFIGYALTPDNWIISNGIDLTSSNSVELSWRVRATDWDFDKENYSVYVATGNQISNFTSSSVSFNENLDNTDASGNFANRSLDISSLAGQMVYVAFRHHGVTDQWEIDIDDFTITSDGSPNGCTIDSDNDGICDADDQCPGFDDTIDTNGNGIPDGCENATCQTYTDNFTNNALSHSGSGSNTTTLTFPSDSQDVSFSISSISQKLKGKASSKYIERVVVTYKDGSGVTQNYNTFSGANVSSASVNIVGAVQSVSVTLSNEYSSNTSSNMNINFSSVSYCSSSSPCVSDSDNDGVCDADDVCPGFDDNIDTNNNGIPDGCESSGCEESTSNFASNSLTHTGGGSNSTTLDLPNNSQDVSFSITGIGQKTKGKASSKYIERAEVSYKDGSGVSQTYGTYSGANVSSATIDIQGKVQSVTVSLSDEFDGNTSFNMSVNLSAVTYCINNTQARSNESIEGLTESIEMKVFPNPATHTLFVASDVLSETKTNITLYNINGRPVRNVNLNGQYNKSQIDLNGLVGGLYLLRIVDEGGNVLKAQRIVIK